MTAREDSDDRELPPDPLISMFTRHFDEEGEYARVKPKLKALDVIYQFLKIGVPLRVVISFIKNNASECNMDKLFVLFVLN